MLGQQILLRPDAWCKVRRNSEAPKRHAYPIRLGEQFRDCATQATQNAVFLEGENGCRFSGGREHSFIIERLECMHTQHSSANP